MKTVFYGGSSYVIPIVDILKQNFGLSLVVTKTQNDPLAKYCKLNNIPVYEGVETLKYIMESENEEPHITLHKADVAIVADFGAIIPKELMNFYPKGIINIHPSLLPKFRGPTPVQTTILEGETITGVTIIKIDESVDHGPILAQREYEITNSDTTANLLAKLFDLGAQLLKNILDDYVNGKLELKNQDHSQSTFTRTFVKSDGYIDLNTIAENKKFTNMIRAFYPWPGVWTKTYVNKTSQKTIKFLPDNKIQVEGKKEMSYKDFLNGYPDANPHLKSLLQNA